MWTEVRGPLVTSECYAVYNSSEIANTPFLIAKLEWGFTNSKIKKLALIV